MSDWCASGKEQFDSSSAAQKVVRLMNQNKRKNNRRQNGKSPARCYKCEICGKYHITGAKDKMKKIKVKYIPTEEQIEVRNINNN